MSLVNLDMRVWRLHGRMRLNQKHAVFTMSRPLGVPVRAWDRMRHLSSGVHRTWRAFA